jgi:hypothetical protein
MLLLRRFICLTPLLLVALEPGLKSVAQTQGSGNQKSNKTEAKQATAENAGYGQHAIYRNTAPMPATVEPTDTTLPLKLTPGDRIALVGNTLLDGSQVSTIGQFDGNLAHSNLWIRGGL